MLTRVAAACHEYAVALLHVLADKVLHSCVACRDTGRRGSYASVACPLYPLLKTLDPNMSGS